MNEWGFIDQDIIVRIGKSATSNIFESRLWRCGTRKFSAF